MICPYCYSSGISKFGFHKKERKYKCRNCNKIFLFRIENVRYMTVVGRRQVFSKQLALDLNLNESSKLLIIDEKDYLFLFNDPKGSFKINKNKQNIYFVSSISLTKFLQNRFSIKGQNFSLNIENNKVMNIISRLEIDLKYSNQLYDQMTLTISAKKQFSLSIKLVKMLNIEVNNKIAFSEDKEELYIFKTDADGYAVKGGDFLLSFTNAPLYLFFYEKYKTSKMRFIISETPFNEYYYKLMLKK